MLTAHDDRAAHCDLPASIFRAYDIRGIAGEELTTQNIRLIGQAIGTLALEFNQDTLLFGADGRLSSPALAAALQEGILSTGCNLVDLGIIPTPLLYFGAHTTAWNSGLMLTASHNPADYNGIKMINQRTCLTPEQISRLHRYIQAGNFHQGRGQVTALDLKPAYIRRLQQDINLQRPLRVVIDCGNAVPSVLAPDLFTALGCEVLSLFCDLDGHFPNHHPDPTIAANLTTLIKAVRNNKADLGIAFDGDGDRVVLITDQGRVIDTDRLLMLFIKDVLPRYREEADSGDKPRVVFDVKCSRLLSSLIQQQGGEPVMSRSGHSFMKKCMQETNAVLGAEFSAHIFFKDGWYGYDDGLYVAARFLALLAAQTESADTLLEHLPKSIVTPELRIDVSDDRKFALMDKIRKLADFPKASINLMDGVRADFRDGWGLIRASNTTPALLLRFEADSRKSLQHIQALFKELLIRADSDLDICF